MPKLLYISLYNVHASLLAKQPLPAGILMILLLGQCFSFRKYIADFVCLDIVSISSGLALNKFRGGCGKEMLLASMVVPWDPGSRRMTEIAEEKERPGKREDSKCYQYETCIVMPCQMMFQDLPENVAVMGKQAVKNIHTFLSKVRWTNVGRL